MDEKRSYMRLGLFVVVSLTILIGLLFVLGGRSLLAPTLTVETYFDNSVAGLGVGSQVSFRGVPVGAVTEISMSGVAYEKDVPLRQRNAYIVVRAKLTGTREQIAQWREEVPAYVEGGLRAQTQLAGITGQQYLALDFFDPEKYPSIDVPWEPEYPYIPSAPSLTGEIVSSAQQFLASLNEADIKALGVNLNRLVVAITEKVDKLSMAKISMDLNAVLEEARGTVERMDRMIAGAPVDEAVRNIAAASARLDALLAVPALEQTIENAAALTGRLRTLAARGELDEIITNLDRAVERIDALIGDNQYPVHVIIEELRATADNLRTLSETAKNYPAGVFIGGPPEKTKFPWSRTR
jgi:ABC-type transporter Mla subunit MlaD